LGALKTLLLEVLALARSTSAAATNAQIAANAATAAMEAVVTLRATIDSALEAATTGAAAAAAAAVSAALGNAGGATAPLHRPCERTPSHLTREQGIPDGLRMKKCWRGNGPPCATLHRPSCSASSIETASEIRIRSSSTATGAGAGAAGTSFAMEAAAAQITIENELPPKPIWRENGTSWTMLQYAEAGKFEDTAAVGAHQEVSEAIIEETGPCPTCTLLNSGSDLLHARPRKIQAGVQAGVTVEELDTLLAAAMRPVRGELKRLRAAMVDVRLGLGNNSACSSAPPTSALQQLPMSLPYWPYPEPPPLQHNLQRAAAQVASADQISPLSSPRRRIRLATVGGSTREARGSQYSSRSVSAGSSTWRNSAGSPGGGLVSWLMGPTRRYEPDDQIHSTSPTSQLPPSLLPAS
jgi:hypothetical protein